MQSTAMAGVSFMADYQQVQKQKKARPRSLKMDLNLGGVNKPHEMFENV
jgi:hypothetical protein